MVYKKFVGMGMAHIGRMHYCSMLPMKHSLYNGNTCTAPPERDSLGPHDPPDSFPSTPSRPLSRALKSCRSSSWLGPEAVPF